MLLVRIAVVAGKANIDMPAGVAGIVRVRETHREGPKTLARDPTPFTNKLIEGGVENGCVCSRPKRLPSIPWQPDDRPRPCRRVVWIAGSVPPHYGATLLGQLPRKGLIDPHESVSHELLYLSIAKRSHGFISLLDTKSSHRAASPSI
jgi:hypothetical protein